MARADDVLHRRSRGAAAAQGHSRSNSDRADSAHGVHAPSPLASSTTLSSAASSPSPSLGRRHLDRASDPDGPFSSSRLDLARRLSLLAHQLSYGHGGAGGEGEGDDDDDDYRYAASLSPLQHGRRHAPVASPSPSPLERRSIDLPAACGRSASGSVLGSSTSSVFRSRFSDLSASLHRHVEPDPPPPQKAGMTAEQAAKVIAEMDKLNTELSAVVSNLKARQEESDHIHGLLVERAERAAQRIMFLQNRITYLEQELEENDDELQHLRICLKAVEIQMPPHPDRELQRCITTFKHDYQALKKKRAARAVLATLDSPPANSPAGPR